jgi:hypothetical protein
MRSLVFLSLTMLSLCGLAQTAIEKEIFNCVVESYEKQKIDVKATLDSFECYLVKNKYLKDKSGQSYISLYEKIAIDGDVLITLGDFNDNGLLQKSPITFFDCYRTRIAEVANSESPLKKLFKELQNNPIDPLSPGEAAKYLLIVIKPSDFKYDVVRYNSLFSFLFTSLPDFPVRWFEKEDELIAAKKFETKLVVSFDVGSNLYINNNLGDLDFLAKMLDNFLIPSADTLKSITLETSRETLHKDFTNTLKTIKDRFQQAREKISIIKYHQKFDSLTSEKKEEVRALLPIKINVTDMK